MIEISEGHYIDINMVESCRFEDSVFFICMTSGREHMVAPSVYKLIIQTKKHVDAMKTEPSY